MNLYVESKLSASDKRFLITKLVGNSWSKINMSLKDFIEDSFLKCGISNKLDRSKYHLINIRSFEEYEMSTLEKEFNLLSDEQSDASSEKREKRDEL